MSFRAASRTGPSGGWRAGTDSYSASAFSVVSVNGGGIIVSGGDISIAISAGSGSGYAVTLGGIDVSDLISDESDTQIQLAGFVIHAYILAYGATTLSVTDGDISSELDVIVIPAPGYNTVPLEALAEEGKRITAVPDLAFGDILEWGNVQGGTISDVTVNSDATFIAGGSVTAFDVRAFTPGEGWGDIGVQSTEESPGPTPDTPEYFTPHQVIPGNIYLRS